MDKDPKSRMLGGYDSMMGILRCNKCRGITNFRPEMRGNPCKCKPRQAPMQKSPRRELQILLAGDRPAMLPNDVCRCHDEACPERSNCRRFLQRDMGGVQVRHIATFRENGKCTHQLKV